MVRKLAGCDRALAHEVVEMGREAFDALLVAKGEVIAAKVKHGKEWAKDRHRRGKQAARVKEVKAQARV